MAYNLISGKMSPRNFALGCAVRSETGSSDDPLVWTPSAELRGDIMPEMRL